MVPDGSLVWTRDGDGSYWLGRLSGLYFYDADGESVDLNHVRPCRWRPESVAETAVPAAVLAAFGRGGRNFQRIHDAVVGGGVRNCVEKRGRGRRERLKCQR